MVSRFDKTDSVQSKTDAFAFLIRLSVVVYIVGFPIWAVARLF